MPYSVHHYYSGSWVDISDRVLTPIKVPYVDRERNYEPKATGLNFEISWAYTNAIANSDQIKIEDESSNVVYSGYVYKSKTDYDNRKYRIELRNHLLLLTNRVITYENLYTKITEDGSSFASGLVKETDWFISNEGQDDFIVDASHGLSDGDVVMFDTDSTNGVAKALTIYFVDVDTSSRFQICTDSALTNKVQFGDWDTGAKYIRQSDMNGQKFFEDFGCQVLNLIVLMFTHAGLTLDITGMNTSVVAAWNTPPYTMHMDGFTIRFDDLWRINQGTDEIQSDSLINYWQFIQKVCAITGTIIKCTGVKTYKLLRGEAETISANDDAHWSLSEESIDADYPGVKFELREDGEPIDRIETGDGRIDWYDNLIFYHNQPSQASVKWLPTQLNTSGADVALKYYKRAIETAYAENQKVINRVTSDSAVLNHEVNTSKFEPTSEIIEEEY